ncbi:Lhr family helicase [Rothia nasimurium]|uniref:Lhr family helicase n=1 Tax=Rothia nasimurium TaxID=85336 RepID=UPI001F00A72B|nr:DEAD/DEAH box helicase [Rothia nasimurium]
MVEPVTSRALSFFSAPTRRWFEGAFSEPTAAQAGAWEAISAGHHALIVAPTGSGKTLSAFLWALDRLHFENHGGEGIGTGDDEGADAGGRQAQQAGGRGTRVLYISPLKALGVDVERNLRAPLIGIAQTARQLGVEPPQVRVGVRSGDTPAKERRQLISNPPDILITTPESLFLMLTSKARSTLTQVHTVIIDEVHAVAGTKRGAHLAVTLERLDQILETPAQRVGLSATVEPVETVARFLGGSVPVQIVRPPSAKEWELTLSVPVPDMTALGGLNAYGEGDNSFKQGSSPRPAPAPAGSGAYLDKLTERTRSQVRSLDATEFEDRAFDDGAVQADTLADAGTRPEVSVRLAESLPQGVTVAEALGIRPVAGPALGSQPDEPSSDYFDQPLPARTPGSQTGGEQASAAQTSTAQASAEQALWDAVGVFPGEEAVASPQAQAQAQTRTQPALTIEEVQVAASAPGSGAGSETPNLNGYQASIWPHVEERIVDLVEANRSIIVFANSRGLAEKLTARLNEIYLGRLEARGELGEVTASASTGARTYAATGGEPKALADVLAEALAKDTPARLEADDERLPGAGASLPLSTQSPAQVMGGSATAAGAPPVLARAHHGSVSKDQRTLIEEALKSGQLRCVVATSSLELGIDMGHVDLVIQVEAPHSVASGLQRVGRAGHQVGEVSRGYLYPKHRGDLLNATVTVQRMLAGQIEPLAIPANPLDILAQQTVAACALGPISVEAWFEALRATAPFATLPRAAFEATLDLLAGKYPSDEFAELRPRIVWDRDAGTIEGRPGAQRLAVTSGGTIPDRGLFPVFIAGAEDSKAPKRVGELDEEMVYESRAGDVIALGASSWRIEDISHDRVTVTPAPGVPGRLPFWHGDSPGRPVDLGRALGAFTRELALENSKDAGAAHARLRGLGLDQWAADNLLAYVAEQAEATGQVPSEKHLLVERFRDELGDWRLILHSPLGMPVHSPWALAVGARAEERYGVNASAMAADDGIVLRIPAMEAEPPGADLFIFDPAELEDIVTERVGNSALFASRFRENAARALLLPRKDPGRRTPLWQQRQRSAQLLDVARKYPTFPLLLETARECLQDVYDLPALTALHKDLEAKKVRISEVETETPSPFARTLLFGYVAQFLYDGDSPLAERRAAALALDPALLAELLGKDELRELLDVEVIRSTEARLQRTAAGYRLREVEGAADLLRLLGPLTAAEAAQRLRVLLDQGTGEDAGTNAGAGSGEDASAPAAEAESGQPGERVLTEAEATDHLEALVKAGRALRFRLHGRELYAAIEDAARLRDALGVPLPIGVPLAFLEPVEAPLVDLVARYARTHAPFTAAQAAEALGLGVSVVDTALRTLAADRRVISGEFLPEELRAELAAARTGSTDPTYLAGTEWVDAAVLRTLRSRSLAALRADVEPVTPGTYARFLPPWQHVGSWQVTETTAAPGTFGAPAQPISVRRDESAMLSGYDGLLTVIDQLAGVRVPASALEPLILKTRISDYTPALLDSAMSAGDVLWTGAGQLAGDDGWVALHLGESAALTLPDEVERTEALAALGALENTIYELLTGGLFFSQIQTQLATLAASLGNTPPSAQEISTALWNLVWAGLVTGDTFAPVRALISGGASAHKVAAPAPRARSVGMRRGASRLSASRLGVGVGRAPAVSAQVAPIDGGRWARIEAEPLDTTVAAAARAELLMDRYGVLTRGAVAVEDTPGGFAGVYRVLSTAEEKGLARRGYFIEGLGAAQFATSSTVDRLRAADDTTAADEEGQGAAPGASAYAPVRRTRQSVTLLAATDPANPYGAALPWPTPVPWDADRTPVKHKPGRKAGAVVVLVDGELTLYLERGGKTLLPFTDSPERVEVAAPLIGQLVRAGVADKIVIETAGGVDVLSSPTPPPPAPDQPDASGEAGAHPVLVLRRALLAAGFYATPRGLRMRKDYT